MAGSSERKAAIRVVVVDDIPSTRENLKKLLSFEDDIEVVGSAGDGREGIEVARQLQPHVVLMDVNMPGMDGIMATETMAIELPQCPVVIMSVQGERDYLRRAMQSGAREFLIKPFTGDELVASIRRVYGMEERKGAYAPPKVAGPPEPEPSQGGQVCVVLSGKGGCGKTFVAINLAVALRVETNAKVCLVDLDLQFGDVGVMLNLDHAKTIILRREFDYVVVDTGSQLSEATLEAIDSAQQILVVGGLTIPAIKDTRLMLKMLDSLKVDRDHIGVLVNGHDAHAVYDAASIERNLKFPIRVQLPLGAPARRGLDPSRDSSHGDPS